MDVDGKQIRCCWSIPEWCLKKDGWKAGCLGVRRKYWRDDWWYWVGSGCSDVDVRSKADSDRY